MSLKIAINGAGGRMGREVIRAAHAMKNITLIGGSVRPGSESEGEDLGRIGGLDRLGIATVSDESAFTDAQAVIDFSTPDAAIKMLGVLPEGCAFITGTTGYDREQSKTMEAAAQDRPIVAAGNFSLGVNLLTALAETAAKALGEDWDIEISETHHRRKADAPSGTALMLGRAAARGRNASLDALAEYARYGQTGPRKEGKIGFQVSRAGGIVGEHEITFTSETERVLLGHTALDRSIFAEGALKAALWAAGQKPGLYDMQDVLGLKQ